MLSFKEFIVNEQRLKGLYRQFKIENPNLPDYISRDMFRNRIGKLDRTVRKGDFNTSNDTIKSFDKQYQHKLDFVKNIRFNKNPIKLRISTNDLHPDTLTTMIHYRFGYKRANVVNDLERTNTQRKLANNTGENEPVVFVYCENKYYLIEGWHRTQAIFLSSAPEEDIKKLENGEANINFKNWPAVVINAYVGTRNNQFVDFKNQQTGHADTESDTIIN